MNNEGELYRALKNRAEMKEYSRALAKDSDRVFVARVKTEGEGFFIFYDIVDIKGESEEGIKLSWNQPEEFNVGCSGLINMKQNFKPLEEDYHMGVLVFAKEGNVLRMNHVGSFANEPTGHEEIEWITN